MGFSVWRPGRNVRPWSSESGKRLRMENRSRGTPWEHHVAVNSEGRYSEHSGGLFPVSFHRPSVPSSTTSDNTVRCHPVPDQDAMPSHRNTIGHDYCPTPPRVRPYPIRMRRQSHRPWLSTSSHHRSARPSSERYASARADRHTDDVRAMTACDGRRHNNSSHTSERSSQPSTVSPPRNRRHRRFAWSGQRDTGTTGRPCAPRQACAPSPW